MEALITLLPGDGIGPEVTECTQKVLDAVATTFGHTFNCDTQRIGGAAIDATGNPLPAATIASCEAADAVFLGAVGGPKWSDPNAKVRPEQGLLGLRSVLGVFANLRPVKVYSELVGASPLRPEILEGVDLVFVRELTGGIYFGEKTRDATSASDLCTYTVDEIERIVRVAARLAAERNGRLCSIDKANVLETSRLWRNVTDRLMPSEFPDIELETLLVDAAAMHLLSRPADFDVLVTETCSGIFSLTRPQCWLVHSECSLLLLSARQRSVCMNRFTARRRILQEKALPIPAHPSQASLCCYATAWDSTRRRWQ